MFEFSSTNKTTVSKSFAKTNTTTLQKKPERSCSNSIANIIANSSAASRIQTKLSIGKPNDKYEKEADMMADKVMTAPANFNKIQKQEKEKEEPQAKIQKQEKEKEEPQAKIQKQEEEKEEPQAKIQKQEEEKEGPQAKIQKQEKEKEEPQAKIQKQEEEKEKPQAKLQLQEEEKKEPQAKIQRQEEEKEELQAKIQKQTGEEPAQTKIQRQANTSESASTNLSTRLSNTKGSGETISDSTRTFMEGQFSADFSNVKVHTDRNAIGMSNELGAQAFTHGSDIYFNEGKYNPDTSGGKHLLAHELTHTMQQGVVRKKNISVETTTSPKIQRLSLKSILNKVANYIPGYSLICVILGKNPITGDKVPRTGINILKGVLGLIPVVGNLLFNRLIETGAAEKAGTWLDIQITKLNITWSGIKALISEVWDRMSIWKGISGNIAVAKEVFVPTLRRIKTFVSAIGTKLKEFILDAALSLAGGAAKSVMDVFKKGKAVFNKILDDPIGFVKNFLKAVKLGMNQFATNFGKHFKNTIFGWLFGTMAEAGIELPKKFDMKGVFNLVMQILGLTYNRIRTRLVKKLGPKGETIVSTIEKGVAFVNKLITEGPVALWEKMKESLGDLKKKIMTAVLAWVTKTIITKAMMKLATMFNPVGALIQAAIAIYNTVMFFIERWNQIKTFVTSIFNSISNIAYGKIKGAANYIENTMAKGLTLLISFLARFIGLGGISKKIQNVIKKIRKPIDKALDRVIDWMVEKGKALFKKRKANKRGDKGTREKNKKAAAKEVMQILKIGIKKSALKTLLKKLKKQYKLKSVILNKNDDVVITNSDKETIKGKPYGQDPNAKQENLALKKEGKKLKKDTKGEIKLGTYKSSGSVFPTLHGAVGNYLNFIPVQFPVNAIPKNAERPNHVEASLTGSVEEGISSNVMRDSSVTTAVGYIGDIESAMRRNVVYTQNVYQGGHIIASRFGGPENYKNIVPQHGRKLNQGIYKKMENFISKNVKSINKAGTATAPVNQNSKVNLDINLLNYGDKVTRTLEDTMKILGSRVYLKEFRNIHNMPENTESEKAEKQKKLDELGTEKSALYKKLSPNSLDKEITIVGRTPESISVKMEFETDVPLGIKGKKEEFATASDKDVKGEIIIAENVKINESGIPKPESGEMGKLEKKNWAATFNFTQSNEIS